LDFLNKVDKYKGFPHHFRVICMEILGYSQEIKKGFFYELLVNTLNVLKNKDSYFPFNVLDIYNAHLVSMLNTENGVWRF
jgi:hypothetical protein